MTIVFEISKPFQLWPGRYKSNICTRYWFLWFAVAVFQMSLKDISQQSLEWEQ